MGLIRFIPDDSSVSTIACPDKPTIDNTCDVIQLAVLTANYQEFERNVNRRLTEKQAIREYWCTLLKENSTVLDEYLRLLNFLPVPYKYPQPSRLMKQLYQFIGFSDIYYQIDGVDTNDAYFQQLMTELNDAGSWYAQSNKYHHRFEET